MFIANFPPPRAATLHSTAPDERLDTLCDGRHCEADAYGLLCRVMDAAGEWFDSRLAEDGSYNDLSVVTKCQQILLRVRIEDGELARAITRIGINPPLYLMLDLFPSSDIVSGLSTVI